jgi:hypothetical protein
VKRPAKPPVDKRWSVRLIRKRGALLGVVYAPDEAATIEALTDDQRKRIVVTRD